MRLTTLATSSSGCACITRAAMPATIGAAPLVPFHQTRPPEAVAPGRRSLGATTVTVDPGVDANEETLRARLIPPTTRTPGIVAGAPTLSVPLPLFPAATTMRIPASSAARKASSHFVDHHSRFMTSDSTMMSALFSTAHFTPSATCWSDDTVPLANEIEMLNNRASGAVPIIPSAPTPWPAARAATWVPCDSDGASGR